MSKKDASWRTNGRRRSSIAESLDKHQKVVLQRTVYLIVYRELRNYHGIRMLVIFDRKCGSLLSPL